MKIFVAKLNFKTTSDALKQLFEQYGTVESAKVITDRETNRSKGFGFVEMTSDTDAIKAIKELDGTDFDGRTIAVQESQEKPRNERSGGGGFDRGNNRGGRDNYRDKKRY